MQSRCCWPPERLAPDFLCTLILDFLPQRGGVERALHDLIQLAPVVESVQLQSRGHVVINRHGGKRVRLLKHHAHAAPELRRRSSVVGVDLADPDPALHARIRNGLVHAIQAADKCRLSTPRGTNQGGGVVRHYLQIDVVQRLAFAVPGIQVLDLDSNTHRLCRSESTTPHSVAHGRDGGDNEDNEYEGPGPRLAVPVIVG